MDYLKWNILEGNFVTNYKSLLMFEVSQVVTSVSFFRDIFYMVLRKPHIRRLHQRCRHVYWTAIAQETETDGNKARQTDDHKPGRILQGQI